jgi:hypothetical protein
MTAVSGVEFARRCLVSVSIVWIPGHEPQDAMNLLVCTVVRYHRSSSCGSVAGVINKHRQRSREALDGASGTKAIRRGSFNPPVRHRHHALPAHA